MNAPPSCGPLHSKGWYFTQAALVQGPSDAMIIDPLLSERYFKNRNWLVDSTETFVASYGHPSHHGVMNASVILTRGTHSGGQVDMHIKMHTSIRTNIFTIIILFMGTENVFVRMPYVRFDREA